VKLVRGVTARAADKRCVGGFTVVAVAGVMTGVKTLVEVLDEQQLVKTIGPMTTGAQQQPPPDVGDPPPGAEEGSLGELPPESGAPPPGAEEGSLGELPPAV
jgi:hypothetical protein